MIRLRRPSSAMVVALLALFVALGGTAVAAGVVPHAKFADKAGVATKALDSAKLQGKTPAQIVASVPAPTPTPPSSVSNLVTIKTAPYALNPNQGADFNVTCDPGQKAIAGGIDNARTGGIAWSIESRPSADGATWVQYVRDLGTLPTNGNLYAICLK